MGRRRLKCCSKPLLQSSVFKRKIVALLTNRYPKIFSIFGFAFWLLLRYSFQNSLSKKYLKLASALAFHCLVNSEMPCENMHSFLKINRSCLVSFSLKCIVKLQGKMLHIPQTRLKISCARVRLWEDMWNIGRSQWQYLFDHSIYAHLIQTKVPDIDP